MILRYTLLRLLIFFGSLSLLWLLGLRSHDALPWLVVGAAVVSMIVSAVVLRPMREQYIADVSERMARRRSARGLDEEVEDAATDASDVRGPQPESTSAEETSTPSSDRAEEHPDSPEEDR